MSEVTTTFLANASQAESAIAKLEKKYADLENKLKQVSKTSKADFATAVQGLQEWATGLVSVGAAAGLLTSVFTQVRAAQAELRREADATNVTYDELIRKLRVQGGLSAAQGQEAQARLQGIAARTGVGFAVAQGTAEEMVSQGFDVASGTGAGLERMLQTIKATNADPGQARQITQAYAALLAATGQDKNAENLENVTRAVQRVFKGTPLQAPDLAALAPKIQGVSNVMPMGEALAQFAVMREKSSPEIASTAMKIIWERLQTANVNTTTAKGLATIQLKPEDVDAIGEAPAAVLDRLAEGLAKIPETERAGVMSQLFGAEAASAATGLIRDRAKVAEYVRLQSDETGFQEDVRVATSGPAAAQARTKLIEENYLLSAGQEGQFEERMRAAVAAAQSSGISPGELSLRQTIARAPEFLGGGPEALVSPQVLAGLLGSDTAAQVNAQQYLDAKVAELRGAMPGGVTAERFLQEATADAAGMPLDERNQMLQQRIAALNQLEGGPTPPVAALVEETKEQTKLLREFLRKASGRPARNPAEGGE
jgi:hypothetical protein